MNFSRIVRRHLELSHNHECGLIPISTQYLLTECAIEIEKLRYVLDGVRGAIKTGRNEPLITWSEQIDIALDEPKT